jgi:hypothetical protein
MGASVGFPINDWQKPVSWRARISAYRRSGSGGSVAEIPNGEAGTVAATRSPFRAASLARSAAMVGTPSSEIDFGEIADDVLYSLQFTKSF